MSSAQLEIATRAALYAGKIINRESLRLDQIEIREKAQFDYVTQADIDCENSICETLHRYFPHDTILTEESGTKFSGADDNLWIVEPLDGTTNFLRGLP